MSKSIYNGKDLSECWRYGMTKGAEEVFNKFNFEKTLKFLYVELSKSNPNFTQEDAVEYLDKQGYTEDQKYILREMIIDG